MSCNIEYVISIVERMKFEGEKKNKIKNKKYKNFFLF